jgi:hypothetical protein
MVNHRPNNNKSATAAPETSKATPAPPAAPPTLEQRISATLTGDLPSAELGELLSANDAAIIAAEQAATAAKEYAYDPTLSPNIAEARERMENTALLVGRLQTLRPRLLTKYRETYMKEQADEWRGMASGLISEGTELSEQLREIYPKAVDDLVSLFARIADFKRRRDACYSSRPAALSDQLPDPELLGRGLDGFTINTPSLLEVTKLFDLAGRQCWPDAQQTNSNRLAVEMSNSVLAMVASRDRDECTPFWHRAIARRQIAAAEEAERQGKRFAEMKVAQEKRENEEAAARWNAAHGTR